ncbi:MAG: UDP-N-acetylmuramoyl-L-alanine--D-glutamate ligase, partial [Atribacterota bacterium]|nr:UDP-N-acetylmuramoyl-L-alanine--D-glutamate ligase [Atribacterota bacterium]
MIINKLKEKKFQKKIHVRQSMAEAVDTAYTLAQPGTNILLSPAATSFGLFVNEFDRGNSFRKAVSNL